VPSLSPCVRADQLKGGGIYVDKLSQLDAGDGAVNLGRQLDAMGMDAAAGPDAHGARIVGANGFGVFLCGTYQRVTAVEYNDRPVYVCLVVGLFESARPLCVCVCVCVWSHQCAGVLGTALCVRQGTTAQVFAWGTISTSSTTNETRHGECRVAASPRRCLAWQTLSTPAANALFSQHSAVIAAG
jgi:hypothetical protein